MSFAHLTCRYSSHDVMGDVDGEEVLENLFAGYKVYISVKNELLYIIRTFIPTNKYLNIPSLIC